MSIFPFKIFLNFTAFNLIVLIKNTYNFRKSAETKDNDANGIKDYTRILMRLNIQMLHLSYDNIELTRIWLEVNFSLSLMSYQARIKRNRKD